MDGATAEPVACAPSAPAGNPALLAAEQWVEELRALLVVSLALAEAGRPLDLAGLDAATGRLCAAVLDLGPELGRRLRPRMVALLEAIGPLEAAIRAAPPPGLARPAARYRTQNAPD
jgi:hypothetical protein